jgi:hypothetical protein
MSYKKVDLAGPEWLELVAGYLTVTVPALGDAVTGVSFSMCEVFTGAPVDIADEQGRAAWWFQIEGPKVTVGRGARDDVDIRAEADYAATLPNARLVYDDAMLEERAAARKAAEEGPANAFDALPADVRACLTGLHNFLAPRTA